MKPAGVPYRKSFNKENPQAKKYGIEDQLGADSLKELSKPVAQTMTSTQKTHENSTKFIRLKPVDISLTMASMPLQPGYVVVDDEDFEIRLWRPSAALAK